MATVTITTTITGKINGRSVSIDLSYDITDVDYTLERVGRIGLGSSARTLDSTTPYPPNMDMLELCYLRMDTLTGSGVGQQNVTTASDAFTFLSSQGETIELHRAEAGGIFNEDPTATTATLVDLTSVEQSGFLGPTNFGFFAAFKPLT